MPTNDDDLTDDGQTPSTPGTPADEQGSATDPEKNIAPEDGTSPRDVTQDAKVAAAPAPVADPEARAEQIDTATAFKSVAPFAASIAGWLVWPLKIAILLIAVVAIVWPTLYFVHLVVPSSVLPEQVAEFKQNLFKDADVYLGRQPEENNKYNPAMSIGASVRLLLSSCLPEQTEANGELYSRAQALFESVAIFAQEIAVTSGQYFLELSQLRSKTVWYASVLIVLGMLTTIVSALNSSQFGSGSSNSASFIKIVAIILPALATAITAYAALNASSDQTALKTQLVFNLTALGAQMNTDLNAIHCPIKADSEIDAVYKKMAAWRQKQTDSILSVEFSQGRPKGGPTGDGGEGDGDGDMPRLPEGSVKPAEEQTRRATIPDE